LRNLSTIAHPPARWRLNALSKWYDATPASWAFFAPTNPLGDAEEYST
jgi:hypothetical protein